MNYEQQVKNFFESLGYKVEKIKEDNQESPDFIIYDDESTYVLELKTKFPANVEIEKRKRILDSGKIFNISESVEGKNRLSGIIKKAERQLKKFSDTNLLRIVWLLSTGHLAEPRLLQFQATLYGLATVVSSKGSGDCYFFYNSEFFRFREFIDGAIVSTEKELLLLINPLSPRYLQLKNSSLPKHLGNAVVDPFELECQGLAFLVDSDVDRNDREVILNYLRRKYGLEDLINLTMNYLSGTIAFSDSQFEE